MANTTRFQTESSLPPLSIKSLKTPNFPSLDNAPQKLTPPPQKTLSPSKLPTFFLSTMHPETTPIPHPEKYALSFFLSLSLFLSKVTTFLLSTMHPRNSHFPPRKIRSLSLSLSLSKSDRASGSAHHFLPRTHSLGRRRAGLHL